MREVPRGMLYFSRCFDRVKGHNYNSPMHSNATEPGLSNGGSLKQEYQRFTRQNEGFLSYTIFKFDFLSKFTIF